MDKHRSSFSVYSSFSLTDSNSSKNKKMPINKCFSMKYSQQSKRIMSAR